MSDITLRYTFDAAGTSPYSRSLGPSLLVQTDGPAAEVFGSNLPDDADSWQTLGTCTGYTPLELTTAFAFLRVESDGAGTVAISAASAASLSVTPASDAVQAGGVLASNGARLPVDSLAQTLGYSGGLLSTITVSFGGTTYVQTLTYTSGNLTGVSQWVAQ